MVPDVMDMSGLRFQRWSNMTAAEAAMKALLESYYNDNPEYTLETIYNGAPK